MNPRPRHSKYGRSSMTSLMTWSALGFPSQGTTRVYWFSTSDRPCSSCSISMATDCRMSSGSNPAQTSGLLCTLAMNS